MPAATRPVTTQDRTFATYFVADVSGQRGHDQVCFHHPNGLVVVCLAESHPMCVGGATTAASGGAGGGRAQANIARHVIGCQSSDSSKLTAFKRPKA